MIEDVEFAILDIPSKEIIVQGFENESDALSFLASSDQLSTQDCEIIVRRLIWSEWELVHPNTSFLRGNA